MDAKNNECAALIIIIIFMRMHCFWGLFRIFEGVFKAARSWAAAVFGFPEQMFAFKIRGQNSCGKQTAFNIPLHHLINALNIVQNKYYLYYLIELVKMVRLDNTDIRAVSTRRSAPPRGTYAGYA